MKALRHISETNWLPFLLIGLMAFFWWQDANRRNGMLEQARVDAALAMQAMNEDLIILQTTMHRNNEIAKISEQPKGKYEITIAGDN